MSSSNQTPRISACTSQDAVEAFTRTLFSRRLETTFDRPGLGFAWYDLCALYLNQIDLMEFRGEPLSPDQHELLSDDRLRKNPAFLPKRVVIQTFRQIEYRAFIYRICTVQFGDVVNPVLLALRVVDGAEVSVGWAYLPRFYESVSDDYQFFGYRGKIFLNLYDDMVAFDTAPDYHNRALFPRLSLKTYTIDCDFKGRASYCADSGAASATLVRFLGDGSFIRYGEIQVNGEKLTLQRLDEKHTRYTTSGGGLPFTFATDPHPRICLVRCGKAIVLNSTFETIVVLRIPGGEAFPGSILEICHTEASGFVVRRTLSTGEYFYYKIDGLAV